MYVFFGVELAGGEVKRGGGLEEELFFGKVGESQVGGES